ncbi:MAG: hypothetical protein NUV93_09180 [Firmicutes bacterium]|nr:hypothetical protein [Bacillota bacterium]
MRRYYRVLEIAKEYGLRRGDVLIAVGQNPKGYINSAEAEVVVRRLDLLAGVQDVERALHMLTEEQREFARLRYGEEWGLRSIARALYRSVGAMPQFERDMLDAFIAALGFIPKV